MAKLELRRRCLQRLDAGSDAGPMRPVSCVETKVPGFSTRRGIVIVTEHVGPTSGQAMMYADMGS